jgi:NAD(P)-dependent dehydrogenase (short-subunit alcohol dehydrogenase family)
MSSPSSVCKIREIMTLSSKRIVVLGGSSGIAQAVARAAAREGAALVIASGNRACVDAALKALPAGAQGHAVDLGSEAESRASFRGNCTR